MIILNQIKCNICGEKIFSQTVHDFKYCGCCRVSVDGGQIYLKRGFVEQTDFTEQSIVMEEKDVEKLVSKVKWSKETNRNDFGIVCAVLREMQELGYDLKNKL